MILHTYILSISAVTIFKMYIKIEILNNRTGIEIAILRNQTHDFLHGPTTIRQGF